VIPPGSTIGILGGGQLGRMIALAAAPLGYRCHIFCPDDDAPAAQVSAAWTHAAYDNHAALDAFAAAIDVATVEFENVPAAALERIAATKPVRPGAGVLTVTQDRLAEKALATRLGIATAPYFAVNSAIEASITARHLNGGAVLKTRRMGYDGKGQIAIAAATPDAVAEAWHQLGEVPCILEGFVDFALEISVVIARGPDGQIAAFEPFENRHANHILAETRWPAAIAPEVATRAETVARALAQALDHVGVMAVEMFVTAGGEVLMNEIAPRVHNSGHLTIEAAATSQFAQHVRAVCGLPLGSTERRADAVMRNLVGDAVLEWPKLLLDSGSHLHLYGKSEFRAGRKMGHVTRLFPLGAMT
jgi:5-(carboxyamino)imidazole ribonucleotide synthase